MGVTKEQASQVEEMPGFEGRYAELGPYTVGWETYSADLDAAPLFQGLPDDKCQSPHWGYVLKGKLVFNFGDHSEVVTEGQAYYAPPGHTPEVFDGTQIIEFSPTDALAATMEVVAKNAANLA